MVKKEEREEKRELKRLIRTICDGVFSMWLCERFIRRHVKLSKFTIYVFFCFNFLFLPNLPNVIVVMGTLG